MLWEHEVPGSNPGAPILVLRYLHLLAMAVFVGGQMVLAFAVVPALREDRPALRAVARRFGWATLVALGVLVLTGTGLAPLRTLIMDLTRYGENPRVHLFFGARYPSELYDLHTLWQIASTNPWLSVTPVSEFNTDPPWAAEYPDVEPPRGLHVRQTGMLPDVVTRYGNWGDRQILICGGPQNGRGHQGGADRKRRTRRAHTTRSPRELSRGRIVNHARV